MEADTDTRRTDRFDLRALYETSQLLSASLDLSFVLNNLLLTAMSKLLVTRGLALLFDPVSDSYAVAACKGISGLKPGDTRPKMEFSREGYLVDDAVPDALAEHGIVLVLPVAFGHRDIGLIGLGPKFTKQPFGDYELEFMMSLVNMSSSAVHNSLMVEELKQANRDLDGKVQQLNTLFDLSQEFNATVDRGRLVKLLTFALMGQMLVQKHVFLLRTTDGSPADEPDGPEIRVVAATGVKKSDLDTETIRSLCALTELMLLDGADDSGEWRPLFDAGIRLVLPIVQNGETCAMLCLGNKMTGQEYQPDEIEFLYALGNLAFVSLQNSYLVDQQIEKERLEEEMRLAREIQERLQPSEIPDLQGVETARLAIPSRHVAGDYFDAIKLGSSRLLVAIGDVTGKGVPASLLMSNLQACLHVLVPMDVSLEEATVHMNRVICENTGFDKFITFFHGIYDSKKMQFDYVNAGHNPATLVRSDGTVELLETGGLLLGVMQGMEYERGVVSMANGDVLAIFTDGVTEAMSPDEEEYGEERLESLLVDVREKSAQEILEAVHEDIKIFTGNAPVLSDDLTLLILKVVE